MSTKTKILVVDNDLATLSRIYLALVHRNYKVEASDKQEEIAERIKRFRPAILIIGAEEYLSQKGKIKIPCIVLAEKEKLEGITPDDEVFPMENPVPIDTLVRTIDDLVI